ncbi:MAG: porin [Gammaproteobacteria bacterium]|nr:MAG: porin [Gammaproteobacteria bacterium]
MLDRRAYLIIELRLTKKLKIRLAKMQLMLMAASVTLCAPGGSVAADEAEEQSVAVSKFSYGSRGLQFDDGSGNNYLWFGVRLQTRWSSSHVSQDALPDDPVSSNSEFKLNRGRLKLGGHLVSPDFTVYSEYDFIDDRLLDLRATYAFTDWLSIRAGQWKSQYNRERTDSSGAQQFVERSVVTPWFTLDRQKAVMLSGRIGKGSRLDTSYWTGLLSGAGRGGSLSDADGLWMTRLQWNITGEVLAFSQSALQRFKAGRGSIAIAAVTGHSRYTSFSSAGGGQLPGFDEGESDQYYLRQWLFETAWQKGGFSWQQELHWKAIDDQVSGEKRRLFGGYAQAGMFFAELFRSFPQPLELAARYARVDPNDNLASDVEKEATLVANWFFNDHRNKLSLDVSRVIRRLAPETKTDNRIRLQWDWSF